MKKHPFLYHNIEFALLVILLSVVCIIGFLKYKILKSERQNTYYVKNLPPNGTVLWQPTPSPSPVPRRLTPGTYSSEILEITFKLPDSALGLETTEPDGWFKVIIRNKNDDNLSMTITRRKKIWGIEGPGEYSCNTISLRNIPIILMDKPLQRCKLSQNGHDTYDIQINYHDAEKSFALGIFYEYSRPPTPDEFTFFDAILSTMKFDD